MDFSKYMPPADSKVFTDEALPANTSKDSSVFTIGAGGQNGAINLVIDVEDAITLTSTKVITVEVKTSADKSNWETIEKKTFSTAPTGRILDYVFPPSSKEHFKVSLTTDDASVVGSLNAYLRYLPR
jgi:hypothetical protein